MTHLKIWVKIWDIIIILENNHKIYVQTVNGTLNLSYDSYKYHFSMCCTKKKNLLKDKQTNYLAKTVNWYPI